MQEELQWPIYVATQPAEIVFPWKCRINLPYIFCNLAFGFVFQSVTDVDWFVLLLYGVCMIFSLCVLCVIDCSDMCRFILVIKYFENSFICQWYLCCCNLQKKKTLENSFGKFVLIVSNKHNLGFHCNWHFLFCCSLQRKNEILCIR